MSDQGPGVRGGKGGTSYASDRLDDTFVDLATFSHHASEQLTFPFSCACLRWRKPEGRQTKGRTSRPSMCSVSGSLGHTAGRTSLYFFFSASCDAAHIHEPSPRRLQYLTYAGLFMFVSESSRPNCW